jgi:DNA-directed RNA polymerase subunit N
MATFPIRCFTCGKLINHRWAEYEKHAEEYARSGKPEDSPASVLNNMGFEKMCCRRHFMSHATSKLESIQMMYPTCEDRIERIGVQPHNSFQKSRARMESIAAEED